MNFFSENSVNELNKINRFEKLEKYMYLFQVKFCACLLNMVAKYVYN